MKSITAELIKNGSIQLPDFVNNLSVIFEGVTGSHAYGVAKEGSDVDLISVVVPPREYPFPHLAGHVEGFGRQKQAFNNFQFQHLNYEGEDIDLIGYSIIRLFSLAMDNNPNVLEALFLPLHCMRTYRHPWGLIAKNRHLFLSKHLRHKMFGFAYSQLNKMKKKDAEDERLYKYGYHCVRLADQCLQVFKTGDLVLDNNVEKLTKIRNGEWSFEDIEKYFIEAEAEVVELYETSDKVPHSPDEGLIKELLLECLRETYRGPVGYYKGLSGCT